MEIADVKRITYVIFDFHFVSCPIIRRFHVLRSQ